MKNDALDRTSALRRLAVIMCGCAVTCLSQPVMSRGQQQLPVNYSDCLNRAHQALRTVGFTSEGAGNFAQGWKEASGAYIICNEIPGSGTVVNIVVASIANDAGVPGQLRQCLQAQMERPGTPACATSSGGAFSGAWYRGGGAAYIYDERGQLYCKNEFGTVSKCRIESATQIRALDWEGGMLGTLTADKQTINWANGTAWQRGSSRR